MNKISMEKIATSAWSKRFRELYSRGDFGRAAKMLSRITSIGVPRGRSLPSRYTIMNLRTRAHPGYSPSSHVRQVKPDDLADVVKRGRDYIKSAENPDPRMMMYYSGAVHDKKMYALSRARNELATARKELNDKVSMANTLSNNRNSGVFKRMVELAQIRLNKAKREASKFTTST